MEVPRIPPAPEALVARGRNDGYSGWQCRWRAECPTLTCDKRKVMMEIREYINLALGNRKKKNDAGQAELYCSNVEKEGKNESDA